MHFFKFSAVHFKYYALCMLLEKWTSMVDGLAKLHEMTVSSEKDALEILKYTEARLRPVRGRGKGKKKIKSQIKSAITVLEWVCYKIL